MSEDKETERYIAEAEKILSWRPVFCSRSSRSNGVTKFFRHSSNALKEYQVDAQLERYEHVLKSAKVRKVVSLGNAEWMPVCRVAKVTKQGKFIQRIGGSHSGDFLALNAEEVLFLLDVADIEFTFNGIPMNFHEALSNTLKSDATACMFDNFAMFSNLSKRGFVVKCCNRPHCKIARKRKLPIDGQSNSNASSSNVFKKGFLCNLTSEERYAFEPRYRGWFEHSVDGITAFEHRDNISDVRTGRIFPDLADRSNTNLKVPDSDLLPISIAAATTPLKRYRISCKDMMVTTSRVRHGQIDIRNKVRNWSEYKDMQKSGQEIDHIYMKGNCNQRALVGLSSLNYSRSAMLQRSLENLLKIPNCASSSTLRYCVNCSQAFCYSVCHPSSIAFKSNSLKRSDANIIVGDVRNDPPDLKEIFTFLHNEIEVPVCMAVIDDFNVLYYEVENSDLPIV